MDKEGSLNDGATVEHVEAIDDALIITRHVQPIDDRVDEETTQVVLEDDDEDGEPEPEQPQHYTPEQAPPEGQQQVRRRFKMVPTFEQADKELFGRKIHTSRSGPSCLWSRTGGPRR